MLPSIISGTGILRCMPDFVAHISLIPCCMPDFHAHVSLVPCRMQCVCLTTPRAQVGRGS